MSDDKNRALDLDELFGQARAVKVKWQGKEYELLPMNAIGPKQALQMQKMQARVTALQLDTEDVSDGVAAELESMFDEMLTVLSNKLPLSEIPFGGKMRIIQFYMEESQGKKKTTMKKKATGARSSRD